MVNYPNPAMPEPNGERTRPRVQFLATRQKLLKYNAKHHAFGEMEATPHDLEVFGESPKTAYGVAFSPSLLTFPPPRRSHADASCPQTSSKSCSLLSSKLLESAFGMNRDSSGAKRSAAALSNNTKTRSTIQTDVLQNI